MDYDIIIIGAGVVGLAIAENLSNSFERILVLEQHSSFGQETSSRNSEVIHAGIYYPTGSLKAKLCVEGNKRLYEWCKNHYVPYNRIGKFIIAVNKEEENELETIYSRAIANGVTGISHISKDEINSIEPNIKAYSGLWSKDTGIIDTHQLMASFVEKANENGVDFAFKHKVMNINKLVNGYELGINGPDNEYFNINCEYIVNCAGLYSDTIAEIAGIDIDKADYRLNYCKGNYFRISSKKKNLVNHLIYPTPPKNLTNLGIHITIDMNGELKLGPDVQYLNNRIINYNVDENLKEKFFKSVSWYLNDLEYDDIYPDQSGIRPKLQGENQAVRDFVISEESEKGLPGLINLIGIESPGLTSCIEIARYVSDFFR